MILYHGSNVSVATPDLTHTRKNVDFGPRFYVTPLKEQAVKWSLRFKRAGASVVVSSYACDEEGFASLKVLRFESYSEEWLDFILRCRTGSDESPYDLVMGGVANDKVFNTVELYLDGLIGKGTAIERLRFEQPNQQICFRTPDALALLHYKGSEKP